MTELGNLFLNISMSAEILRSGQDTFRSRRNEAPTIR
jgi:hypothetical protein